MTEKFIPRIVKEKKLIASAEIFASDGAAALASALVQERLQQGGEISFPSLGLVFKKDDSNIDTDES